MVEEMRLLIGFLAVGGGLAIPITAILTAHKRAAMKLQIQMIEKETELEKLKMESYEIETQKLRLELQQEKQVLLEMENKER
ncbi:MULTISPECIES: hypothetical protein [Bacillales]|uniref:Uncharacterized protein n=1 Tax=Lysinibacillus louembei TaxID=1470088 RepID=A0ABZ0RWV1_9BACI|nr:MULTISPECIES: hypothetical protein [Bacillales]MCT6923157.1 hypothetical protein [Metasolibacillus sp.]MCT6939538.1 hypothetical protein [Metasolibacillus sp.]WPK11722.1 hypothetical protein R6U77_17800 [Lysinibacillus louembei]